MQCEILFHDLNIIYPSSGLNTTNLIRNLCTTNRYFIPNWSICYRLFCVFLLHVSCLSLKKNNVKGGAVHYFLLLLQISKPTYC